MRAAAATALVITMLAGTLCAASSQTPNGQPSEMWRRLGGLSAVPVEVRLKDGRLMTGHVAGVSGSTLALLVEGQTTSVDEEQVSQVYQLVRKSPALPILAGAGVGLAGAGLISVGLDEIFVNAPEASMFAIAPAAGATIGYIFGRGTRRVLIYDAGAAGALATPRTAGASRMPGVSVLLAWVGIRRGVSVNVSF